MRNAPPTHVGDVKKTVQPVQVNEGTIVGNVLYHTPACFARLDLGKNFALLVLTPFLNQFSTGNDYVLSLPVNLNDLEVKSLPDELVQVLGSLNVDLGGRQKCVHANVNDQSTLYLGTNPSGNDGTFLAGVYDLFPVLLLLGFVKGKLRVAVTIFQAFQINFQIRTDFEFSKIEKFVSRDCSFGFPSEINDDFGRSDFHNGSGYYGTFF